VISRNDTQLVWQYIDWDNVVKYIDNLKSRIYKAFLFRYLPEIYQQQSLFINSQLVIIWAIKNSIFNINISFNTFEIGYCIFCLSNSNYLDLSFYSYYREDCSIDRISEFKYFIRQIKHLIIISCLEPYYNYLLYLNNLYNIKFYNLYNFNYRFNDQLINKYSFSFDLSSYIRYMYVSVLLDKLYLHKTIKQYLFEFLDLGIFINILFYLDFSSISLFLYNNNSSLMAKLLEIFLMQFCYEVSVMLLIFYVYKDSMSEFIFINDRFSFIVLSKDKKQIKRIRRKLLNILLFNGIYIIKKPEIQTISLLKGTNINLFYISTNYQVYPFYIIIRPSLYSQFLLMKRLSAILIQSISKPLFVLIIRFNMLLFFWLINYTEQPVHRIIYLIDYLITLKLRLFINKKKLNLHMRNLGMCIKNELCLNYDHIYLDKVVNKIIFTTLSNSSYFNYYIVVKLFWIYRLKCNVNLREAV